MKKKIWEPLRHFFGSFAYVAKNPLLQRSNLIYQHGEYERVGVSINNWDIHSSVMNCKQDFGFSAILKLKPKMDR